MSKQQQQQQQQLVIIGPSACIAVGPFSGKVTIKLENIKRGHFSHVYSCEISTGESSTYCKLYQADKPPKTSSGMIMKIFCQRLRKIVNLNGVIDMTDVFSQTTAVEMENSNDDDVFSQTTAVEMENSNDDDVFSQITIVKMESSNDDAGDKVSGNSSKRKRKAVKKIKGTSSISEKMKPKLSNS